MKKEKHYQIKTFAQLDEIVTEDNIGGFLTDFSRWIGFLVATRGNKEMEMKYRDTFHWIDDGKIEIKTTIEIVPPKPEN